MNQTGFAFMFVVLPLCSPALTASRTCDEIQLRALRGR
jgi:hypothetical protein